MHTFWKIQIKWKIRSDFIQFNLFYFLSSLEALEPHQPPSNQLYNFELLESPNTEMRPNIKTNNTKNFKKKNSNLTIEIPKQTESASTDRFTQLRNKLEKQKQMMKKTGRRFKDENSISIQSDTIEPSAKKPMQETNKCEIMIGTDDQQPPLPITQEKDIVNLNEMSIDNNESCVSMRSSKAFENQFKNQKKRETQLLEFLTKIQLESFFDQFVNAGFDDLDSLSGVTTEDLNHMMMRAKQQDRLFRSLKEQDLLEEDQKSETKSSRPSTSSTQWRIKTEGSLSNSQLKDSGRMKTLSAYEILQQAKKNKQVEKPTSFMGNSFIYMVGSKSWSLQDQIRRACSNCFRVSTQMEKKGDCYYCETCYKVLANDLLNITIGEGMNKSYKKLE